MSLHPRLCRSVRLLLGWSQADLARRAGISHVTVRNFEHGLSVQGRIETMIRDALRTGGIDFEEREGRATISFAVEPHEPTSHKDARGGKAGARTSTAASVRGKVPVHQVRRFKS